MSNLIIQPAFSAGEIGPELYGRVDNQLYYSGLRTVENMVIQQYGGARFRNGTEFISPCRYPERHAVCIQFQYSTEQTYALEFGHLYMRVVKDGGQVLEANKTITDITQANPAVVTSAAHGYSNGDDVYISGVEGMDDINGRWFRVANVTANTFELTDYYGVNISSAAYGAYTSGGTVARVYTLTTIWDESMLDDLSFTQNKDILTICYPTFYPQDISRTGHANWSLNTLAFEEGPFQDINTDTALTVIASAATGAITLTASSALFTADMVDELFYIEQTPDDTTERWEAGKAGIVIGDIRRAGFHYYEALNNGTTGTYRPDWTEGSSYDGDGGVQWKYLHSGFGVARITGFTSTTVVNATVVRRLPTLSTTTATYNWAKAAWGTANGGPATSVYHGGRLWFGGSTSEPQTLWGSGSQTRTYFGKSNPILDNDSVKLTLDALEVNEIRHLLPMSSLIALTSSSEIMISGQSGKTVLATETPLTENQGFNGSSKVRPIIVNNTALFVQEGGSVTRSLVYTFDSDTFTGINLMARSPHIFDTSTLRRWSYAKVPDSVVWAVRNDGVSAGLTYLKEQEVYAWHRHITDGAFESVCTVTEDSATSTYFIVKRTIGGKDYRYMERLRSRRVTDVRNAYHVDAGVSFDGRNTGATTMYIAGGTNWDEDEPLTVTSSASFFEPDMVGDAIVFWLEGIAYRLEIDSYVSATEVVAYPNRILATALREAATTDWEYAKKEYTGLWHLEGKTVTILADGNVHPRLLVTGGKVTLQYHASVVHIGLGYTGTLETLDMTTPQQNLRGMTFNIPRVYISVQASRGIWIGEDAESATEYQQRGADDGYDEPLPLITQTIEQGLINSWNSRGRVVVQQRDPLPLHVLNIIPEVVVSKQGGGG